MDWNLSLDKNCNLQWFFTLMTKIKQKMWDASNNQHQSNLVSFKYNPFCVNLIKQSVTNGNNSYQEWIGPLKSQADGALFSHEENTFLFVLEWSARKLKLKTIHSSWCYWQQGCPRHWKKKCMVRSARKTGQNIQAFQIKYICSELKTSHRHRNPYWT